MGKGKQIEKECEYCGKIFFPLKKDVNRGKGKYCSRTCSNKDRLGRRLSEFTCKVCGKILLVENNELKWRKYCSRECCNEDHRRGGAAYKYEYIYEKIIDTCNHCGEEYTYEWRVGKPKRKYCSDACSRAARIKFKGEYWYRSIIIGAKRRRILFDVSEEYLMDLMTSQNWVCTYTGLPLSLKKSQSDKAFTASLDRIDCNIGYIEGNVVWVNKYINRMKWMFTDEEYIAWCNLVAHKCPMDAEKYNKIISNCDRGFNKSSKKL